MFTFLKDVTFYSEIVISLAIVMQISSFDSSSLFQFNILNRSANNL